MKNVLVYRLICLYDRLYKILYEAIIIYLLVVHMKRLYKYCRFVYTLSPKYFFLNIIYNLIMASAWLTINYALKLLSEVIVNQDSDYIFLKLCGPILLYFVCAILLGGSFYYLEQVIQIKFVKKSVEKLVWNFSNMESGVKHDLFYDDKFYNEYLFAKKNQHKIIEVTTLIMNKTLVALFNVVLSVLAIIYFDNFILILLIIISLISFMLNNYIAKKNYQTNKEQILLEREINYINSLLSDRSNSKEIRMFRLSNVLINKWKGKFELYNYRKLALSKKNNKILLIIDLCEQVLNYIFVFYLIFLVLKNEIAPGDAIFLQGTFWVLNYGINTLITLISKNIFESLKYIKDYDEFVEKYQSNIVPYENNLLDGNDSVESIELKNVSYKYPNSNNYALKNVSIKINKGDSICLIGDNGSGKSTLSKILCGLLNDYSGEILINKINIRTIAPRVLFDYFGVAFQEFNRYSMSLRDNILIGSPNQFDERRYIDVLKENQLDELISGLPYEENTILGKEYSEFGVDLSVGQWQRVILARAYLKNAQILILDEPTASIDPQEEARLINSFRKLIENYSIALLITHRIGFAKMSNRIIVMKNGEIIESGGHKELLALKQEYYQIYSTQKHLYE